MVASTSEPTWLSRPERGSLGALRLMARIALWFGRPVARTILPAVVAWFWILSPSVRADSARYLERVLGHPVGARHTFRHFLCFSTTILDRVYLLSGRTDTFEVTVEGAELLDACLADGRGAFLVGGHMGSFEALQTMARGRLSHQVFMAMFENNARKIGAFLRTLDPAMSSRIVALGQADSLLRIQGLLDEGHVVGFLADRAHGQDTVQTEPFLGAPAPFPQGVFRVAAVMQRPVIAMCGLYLGGNRYTLRFEPVADFSTVGRSARREAIASAVQVYARTLEGWCHRAPYNWFNFYDFWQTVPVKVTSTDG